MSYILMIVMSAANGHATVSMQEFETLQACQFASSQITSMLPKQMACVPKGKK